MIELVLIPWICWFRNLQSFLLHIWEELLLQQPIHNASPLGNNWLVCLPRLKLIHYNYKSTSRSSCFSLICLHVEAMSIDCDVWLFSFIWMFKAEPSAGWGCLRWWNLLERDHDSTLRRSMKFHLWPPGRHEMATGRTNSEDYMMIMLSIFILSIRQASKPIVILPMRNIKIRLLWCSSVLDELFGCC